jgi:DNA-binding NtrC family response regulator
MPRQSGGITLIKQKQRRILLADQDEQVLADYHAYFNKHGYEVVTCRDGVSCADALRNRSADVMVLDPDLPWGSGDGVLALMGEGDLPSVPVILLAAPSPRRFPSGRFPIRAFLTKPVMPDHLEETIVWAVSN